jgi:hypothetical protein
MWPPQVDAFKSSIGRSAKSEALDDSEGRTEKEITVLFGNSRAHVAQALTAAGVPRRAIRNRYPVDARTLEARHREDDNRAVTKW